LTAAILLQEAERFRRIGLEIAGGSNSGTEIVSPLPLEVGKVIFSVIEKMRVEAY
jgi:hypothetical protein